MADFAAVIPYTSVTADQGVLIHGPRTEGIGLFASIIGDVNGDGLDDPLLSASQFGGGNPANGASYVVFGRQGGFNAASFDLATLDGTNGFKILGAPSDYLSRKGISSGDFNGDGYADLLLGSHTNTTAGNNAGGAYVIFGRETFGATVSVAALNGQDGFLLSGASANNILGNAVASAGDLDGDGKDEVAVVGSNYGLYILFGSQTENLSGRTLSVSAAQGVLVVPEASYHSSSQSLAAAGDVNGDGYEDLIIGAYMRDQGGLAASGAAYLVYGRANFGAGLDVTASGVPGVVTFPGVASADYWGMAVGGGGDLNGDGRPDIVVGSPYTVIPSLNATGAVLVLYSPDPAGPVSFIGSAANDSQSGGSLADNLSGMGGNDVLYGLGGDDILDGGDGADKLFGGSGADLLDGGLGNDRIDGEADVGTLNGGAGNDYLDGGLGADVMRGGADNDVYIVDNLGDQTIENPNEGYDIVRTAIDGWTLAANIEGLELQGAADINGSGNAEANNLQGNSGANRLDGGAGVDTINGNDGDDIIIGGEGNDLLRGGLGADTFLVAHAFGPVLETDQVYDFSTAEGDIMDLSGAFAGTISKVDAFTKAAGQMTLTFASGITTLRLDINGDGKADYQAKINGDWGGWML